MGKRKVSFRFDDEIKFFLSEVRNGKGYDADIKALSKDIKKIINATLQTANRRIQNIENSDVVSTAYISLMNELGSIDRYTKFTIAGLDLTDKNEVVKAVNTYSRALTFLNNKTSSVTGSRAFIKNLSKQFDLPIDVVSEIITDVMQPQLTNGQLVINNFDSERIRNLVSEVKTDYNLNDNYEQYRNEILNKITNLTNGIDDTLDIWD